LTWPAFGPPFVWCPRFAAADERLELVDRNLDRSGHPEALFEQELLDD
jgi:hypothetical protein